MSQSSNLIFFLSYSKCYVIENSANCVLSNNLFSFTLIEDDFTKIKLCQRGDYHFSKSIYLLSTKYNYKSVAYYYPVKFRNFTDIPTEKSLKILLSQDFKNGVFFFCNGHINFLLKDECQNFLNLIFQKRKKNLKLNVNYNLFLLSKKFIKFPFETIPWLPDVYDTWPKNHRYKVGSFFSFKPDKPDDKKE